MNKHLLPLPTRGVFVRSVIRARCYLLVLCVLILASGCSGSSFKLKDLAKSDIDFVADAHYQVTQGLLRELTTKLYLRNPVQLTRAQHSGITLAIRQQQLFGDPGPLQFAELNEKRGTEALDLALDQDFSGDRVFALLAGLTGMIRASYGYRDEFFMLDKLDEQKLYESARNMEILLWRLSMARNTSSGQPLILTNYLPGETANLSFERLFGKLVATQDMLGLIAAQTNNRLISQVAHNTASLVFFPL